MTSPYDRHVHVTVHSRKTYADTVPVKIQPVVLDGPTIAAAITKAIRAAQDAAQEFGRGVQTMMTGIARWYEAARARMVEAANHPVHVAGLEGLYLVRAGQDPAYRTEAALVALVASILDGTDSRDLHYLTPENRATVAAAALYGWTSSYPAAEGPEVLAWHRLFGDVHVQIGRAA